MMNDRIRTDDAAMRAEIEVSHTQISCLTPIYTVLVGFPLEF